MGLFSSAAVGGGGALIAQCSWKNDRAIVRRLFGIIQKLSFSIPCIFFLPAPLETFVFMWPVIVSYLPLRSDEIVKLPWIYPRYKKYLWLKNLTREEGAS